MGFLPLPGLLLYRRRFQTIGCFNEDLIGITCQQYEDGSWDYSDEMLNDERGVAVAVGDACPLPRRRFWLLAPRKQFQLYLL